MIWMKTDDVWIGTLSIGYRTDVVGPSKASSSLVEFLMVAMILVGTV